MALSELHIALIVAGVLGVLLVWAYNVWQDRQHRKTAERIFGEGKEPAPAAADPGAAPVADRQEPYVAAEEAAPEDEDSAPAGQAPAADIPAVLADPIAECTLSFVADPATSAPLLHSIAREWSAGLGKPLRWLARGEDGAWLTVAADDTTSRREWAAVLQLADRRGPAGEAELARFFDGMQGLARQVGAALQALPSRSELAAHAAALDSFCAGVDIQFSLHVVEASGGSLPGTKIRGLAEAAGLVLEDDGLFRLRDAEGVEMFSLGNLAPEAFEPDGLRNLSTHGISFGIDVPRVADGPAAFERMLAMAQQAAQALGGVLVDAQRVPLSEAMIAAIRAKVAELQQQMREGGIEPGSPRALRLFS